METLNVILPNLRADGWAVSLDLKDAYLHVPVHPQSRRLLGFKYQDKTYVYKVLPFGLKDSPWVFSRIVATVIAHLRLQGIRIFYYLDDWTSPSRSFCPTFRPLFSWPRVWGSSSIYRSQCSPLRGCLSRYPQVNRTSGGAQSGGSTVAHTGTYHVSDSSCSPVAESSRPFGQLRGSGSKLQASHAASSAALPSILLPPVGLLVETDSTVSRNQGSVCSLGVSASPSRREAFLPTPPPPHSLVLTSDASQFGWGAILLPHWVSGTWSQEESLVYINSLELRAVFLALKSLEVFVVGQSLLVRSDNTTVVSYINFQGGTHSLSLCLLAIEIWEWCIQRGSICRPLTFQGRTIWWQTSFPEGSFSHRNGL